MAARIASFSALSHLRLEVVFEDGRGLRVEFDPARLAGPLASLSDVSEFATAYLR